MTIPARTATLDILMCAPSYYTVTYSINPWMDTTNGGKPHLDRAIEQWQQLRLKLSNLANIKLVEPQSDVPDMVFTANAGLIYEDKVVLSRFRFLERQAEEPHFEAWFRSMGFDVAILPTDCYFEGEGDALFDAAYPLLWAGHGFRTALKTHDHLREIFSVEVQSLHLVDPRFYHLDTCFAPLAGGYVVYYPAAFDEESRQKIEAHFSAEKRIAIGEDDAQNFACNIVNVGTSIILNSASLHLKEMLVERGFTVIETPLSEFIKSGGAAKCLTLNLNNQYR